MTIEVRDARAKSRFYIDNAIIKVYGPRLGPYGLAVYMSLCMHASNNTQQCWPSHKALGEEIGMSSSSVKEALRSLKNAGLIKITGRIRQGENGEVRQTTNLYTLLSVPEPELPQKTECKEPLPSGPTSGVAEEVEVADDELTDDEPAQEPASAEETPHEPGAPKSQQNVTHLKDNAYAINAYASANTPTSTEPMQKSVKSGTDSTGKDNKPSSKTNNSKSDPRSKTPAIQCARGVAGRYPDKSVYDLIINALGDHPDGRKLANCREAWVACGHNKNSWAWLLDWYVNGIPEYARKVANLTAEKVTRKALVADLDNPGQTKEVAWEETQ